MRIYFRLWRNWNQVLFISRKDPQGAEELACCQLSQQSQAVTNCCVSRTVVSGLSVLEHCFPRGNLHSINSKEIVEYPPFSVFSTLRFYLWPLESQATINVLPKATVKQDEIEPLTSRSLPFLWPWDNKLCYISSL